MVDKVVGGVNTVEDLLESTVSYAVLLEVHGDWCMWDLALGCSWASTISYEIQQSRAS